VYQWDEELPLYFKRYIVNAHKTRKVYLYIKPKRKIKKCIKKLNKYEGWNFNNGNYLFTTDTK